MLSVVIPTKDRRQVLLDTLGELAEQEPPEGGVELVVVDNGSSDGTAGAVRERAGSYPHSLSVIVEPRPGPATARNTGASASRGDVLLFLGDDMAPATPGLLAEHARLHAARPDSAYSVLGRVTWNPAGEVTPFMEWLESAGIQFDFGSIGPGPVTPSRFFCTAHVSLKRSLFEEAGGFDERFPDAAIEDIELGVRLEERGVELDYHPGLLVLHTHPTTRTDSVERLRRVGRSAALFHEIRPGAEPLQVPSGPRWTALDAAGPFWSLLSAAGRPARVRRLGWRGEHMRAYRHGYRQGPPATGSPAPA